MKFWNTLKIENMNNEKMNQMIDEAYNSYLKHTIIAVNTGLDRVKGYLNNCLVEYDGYYEHFTNPSFQYGYRPHTKEEFINKCKTDSEFSERWGLKIDERELSNKERINLAGFDYENRGLDGDKGICEKTWKACQRWTRQSPIL